MGGGGHLGRAVGEDGPHGPDKLLARLDTTNNTMRISLPEINIGITNKINIRLFQTCFIGIVHAGDRLIADHHLAGDTLERIEEVCRDMAKETCRYIDMVARK